MDKNHPLRSMPALLSRCLDRFLGRQAGKERPEAWWGMTTSSVAKVWLDPRSHMPLAVFAQGGASLWPRPQWILPACRSCKPLHCLRSAILDPSPVLGTHIAQKALIHALI